jgi:S-adenosylmethionine decarboxylase
MMGQHFLLNIYDVDPILLTEHEGFVSFIRPTLRDCMAVVVEDCVHKFEPGGYTYIALLSTSHFSIHTWPEHSCAALDMFTCGDIQVDALNRYLLQYFAPKNYDLKKLTR